MSENRYGIYLSFKKKENGVETDLTVSDFGLPNKNKINKILKKFLKTLQSEGIIINQ